MDYIGTNADKRVFGLDFLRAAAIILVLVDHYSTFIASAINNEKNIFGQYTYIIKKTLSYITPYGVGSYGVALFFVLSGFLIGQILIKQFSKLNGFKTLKNFWIRRWLRTLPNYYLFLAANTVVFIFLFRINLDFSVWFPYLFFLQNFATNISTFFGESWSLTVEEWFYILTPAIALLIAYAFKIRGHKPVFYSAIILFFLSVLIRFFFIKNFNYTFFTLRPAISLFDGVSLGVIFACIKYNYNKWWVNKKNNLILLLFGLAILSVCLICGKKPDIKNLSLLVGTLFHVGVYLSFAFFIPIHDHWTKTGLNFKKIIQAISSWAYSIYLCNWLLRNIFLNIMLRLRITSFSLTMIFVYIPFVLAISWIIYEKFEKPILNFRDNIKI